MEDLMQLKKNIFSNGRITEQDVADLHAMLSDEKVISREKADFLFQLRCEVNSQRITKEFEELFIDTICKYLLNDEDSPGSIDEDEAKWLRAKLQFRGRGHYDKLDNRLLDELRERSINFPEILDYKDKFTRATEAVLYSSRYLPALAVIGSILSAVILFLRGFVEVGKGVYKFFRYPVGNYDDLLATFVSSVDIFLFGMVLVIFGVGVYGLFINRIDSVQRKAAARLSWMQISSIDDLKSSLGKVILMVLIVTFFKYSLKIEFETPAHLLLLSIGVVLISTALYIAHAHREKKDEKHGKKEAQKDRVTL